MVGNYLKDIKTKPKETTIIKKIEFLYYIDVEIKKGI